MILRNGSCGWSGGEFSELSRCSESFSGLKYIQVPPLMRRRVKAKAQKDCEARFGALTKGNGKVEKGRVGGVRRLGERLRGLEALEALENRAGRDSEDDE